MLEKPGVEAARDANIEDPGFAREKIDVATFHGDGNPTAEARGVNPGYYGRYSHYVILSGVSRAFGSHGLRGRGTESKDLSSGESVAGLYAEERFFDCVTGHPAGAG